MAEFIAHSRTNCFVVKDVDALKETLRSYGLEPYTFEDTKTGADFVLDLDEKGPTGSVSLFSYGSWPSLDEGSVAMRLGVEDDEDVPQKHEDLVALVASHLADGQVAVFMQVGFENMRYLDGVAVAVNASNERRTVVLDDIYALSCELTGPDTTITRAEY